jgi:hypothetical protein
LSSEVVDSLSVSIDFGFGIGESSGDIISINGFGEFLVFGILDC